MPGECNQKNIVYQAEVSAEGKIMTYFGSTTDFKKRYAVHKHSLTNRATNQTEQQTKQHCQAMYGN